MRFLSSESGCSRHAYTSQTDSCYRATTPGGGSEREDSYPADENRRSTLIALFSESSSAATSFALLTSRTCLQVTTDISVSMVEDRLAR